MQVVSGADLYRATDIGTLAGTSSCMATDINDHGQIVGECFGLYPYGNGFRQRHLAFLWEKFMMLDLGTLGGETAHAYAINNSGRAVGMASTPDHHNRAFLWDGLMESLDGRAYGYSTARGINDLGEVVGEANTAEGDCAVSWVDGAMVSLGKLPGSRYSRAEAVNDLGQVVGISTFWVYDPGTPIRESKQRAVVWENGAMRPLTALGGEWSRAVAVNNWGQVAGMAEVDGHVRHACLWQGDTVQDLGALPDCHASDAQDINDVGQVVGWCEGRAFIWEDGVMRDLNDLVPDDFAWTLHSASCINNPGQIVAQAYWDSQLHSFLLSPVIQAEVDLQPESLSLRSKGQYVTCYIELPPGYLTIQDIDVSTLRLQGSLPPSKASSQAGDYDSDSCPDLTVKFGRSALCGMLSPGQRTVALSGSFTMGVELVGEDTVTVRSN